MPWWWPLVLLAAAFLGVNVWWRFAARRTSMPCPA